MAAAVAFHADHLDQLPAPGDQFGQNLRLDLGNRARFGADTLGEQGDDLGIERVGLRQAPGSAGEIADLAGIDHGQRQASPGQGRGDGQLKAAGGLQHDQRRGQPAQLDYEPVEALALARNGEGLLRRQHMHVEAVL